jgi:Predicted signal-transduction protein containing cAMP-binding and CBS domains
MEQGTHDDDDHYLDHDNFSSPVRSGPTYDLGKDNTSNSGITDTGIHSSAIMKNIVRKNTLNSESIDAPYIILPWKRWYRTWWAFLVVCAAFTAFFESYEIAFAPAGLSPYDDASSIIDYLLMGIFSIDIMVHFNLAYYDAHEELVYDRKQVARKYLEKMFWIDVIGVFPFYEVMLAITGELGQDSRTAQYLALFRLFRLVRLHRVKRLFEIIHYSTKISLITLTLIRNFVTALVWTHVAACIFYFIARQYSFDADKTWLGDEVLRINAFERYVTTLYWSIVTFTTVGYGDWSPVNSVEQIWGMIYMLINIVIQSWIIGSITLLVVKNDEKTGNYRDTMETLDEYSKMHSFPKDFKGLLKTQLKLDFDNQEVADENVLQHFPISVRRKVLRRLYLPYLNKTKLMNDVRQQFIDEFLTTCKVEIYSPGEEIIERNTISSHLYLLVEGVVELGPFDKNTSHGTADGSTVDDSTVGRGGHRTAGEFINPFSFLPSLIKSRQ